MMLYSNDTSSVKSAMNIFTKMLSIALK